MSNNVKIAVTERINIAWISIYNSKNDIFEINPQIDTIGTNGRKFSPLDCIFNANFQSKLVGLNQF
jgi:hypothetical protein